MKTVLDKTTRDELITRINMLSENSTPQWGKMNVCQMLKHCSLVEEMFMGEKKWDRAFLGRVFGKMALKNLLKDERPLGRNAPTLADFKVTESTGDVESEKKRWIKLIGEYADFSSPYFPHWFFGKMSKEQVGYFVYKHADHHLRQFNS